MANLKHGSNQYKKVEVEKSTSTNKPMITTKDAAKAMRVDRNTVEAADVAIIGAGYKPLTLFLG